jgi:peptide/nickel transport system substrate-binding protein
VVGLEAAPTNLDPRLATDAYSERIDQLIFNGLVRRTPQGETVPDLADRWEVKADRVYTFHLRPGVRFQDGTALTSDDVRYTFESLLSPAFASPYKKDYAVIDRIETPDPATVRFVLKEPFAPFLLNLTRGIVPRHLAETAGKNFSSEPLGTGPFLFTRWIPDQAVELTANPSYYEGAPKIQKVIFRIIPEESTRLLELLAGSVDFLENALSPDLLDRIEQTPGLAVYSGKGNSYSYMGFNLADPILKDLRVRRAIAMAIDREGIIKNILRGTAEPATGLLPPGHWAYDPDVRSYPYAPREAKRLLSEAGYRLPLRLSFKTSQNELARRIAEAIQHQLAGAGIEIDLRTYEWGTFYADIKAGNFQLYTLSWVGVNDPDLYYMTCHSESLPPAGANRGRYIDPEMDRWLIEGRKTLDRNRRARIYAEVQKRAAERLPYVSLWYTKNIVVMKRNIKGFLLYPGGDLISLKRVYRAAS